MSEKEGLYPKDVVPPLFTIIEQRGEGTDMVTEVIMDEQCMTFAVPMAVYRAGRHLKTEVE
jgi:hypothetical protein